MNNIFENVKFGDKFKTRDGRLAIFIRHDGFDMFFHIEGDERPSRYDEDGKWFSLRDTIFDIVARWNEPIDEEKLDELANNYSQEDALCQGVKEGYSCPGLVNAFKAGYRKAKKELL